MRKEAPDRFDHIGWGLFFVFLGILWILPEGTLPAGSFFIGTGIILLLLALIKYLQGYKPGWFSIILGVVVLVKGIGESTDISISISGLIILLLGIGILISSFKK